MQLKASGIKAHVSKGTGDKRAITLYKSGIPAGQIEYTMTGGRYKRSRIMLDDVERAMVNPSELQRYTLSPQRTGYSEQHKLLQLLRTEFLED